MKGLQCEILSAVKELKLMISSFWFHVNTTCTLPSTGG